MARYRKRPLEIEAIQWTGENWDDIVDFPSYRADAIRHDPDAHSLLVDTSEGRMRCSPGDWLIYGIKGEFYPCKPDVFDATYEAVDVLETA